MATEICIFTIGHSNHSLGTFLRPLRQHQVEALVDVRRYPRSRRHPHFNMEKLSASLKVEGVEYHWLECLGGNRRRSNNAPSPNRGIEDESFRNYADYMASEEFRQGVATLLEIARNRRTALMCAEGDYRHCHRQLISDYLVASGITVQHILSSGEARLHLLAAAAKIVEGHVVYPGPPTLFEM